MVIKELIAEIDEAINWVENEYGFVTDALKKAKAKLIALNALMLQAERHGLDENPTREERCDAQDALVEAFRKELI